MKIFTICIVCLFAAMFSLAQTELQPSGIAGKWVFVSYSEKDLGRIPDNQLPALTFTDSSKTVSGSAGCNKINGSYEIDGERFSFGPMMSTFKACPDMEVERFITRFLTRVGSYKIEDNKLYLYEDQDKDSFVVFRKNGSSLNHNL